MREVAVIGVDKVHLANFPRGVPLSWVERLL